jgi:hypothetical protein
MYSSCVYCHQSLGKNDAIEEFPVGKRLAFDGAQGRLWVVCPNCARWNLSPLDVRWEAIERMQQLFRDTPLRASTGQIGLAQLADRTELVRIGTPELPEFSAWRYGRELLKRFSRHAWREAGLLGAQFTGVGAVYLVGGNSAAFTALSSLNIAVVAYRMGVMHRRARLPRYAVVDGVERPLLLSAWDISRSELQLNSDGPQLRLFHRELLKGGLAPSPFAERMGFGYMERQSQLTGAAVGTALTRLLPVVNHNGDSPAVVRRAVELLQENRDPHQLLRAVTRLDNHATSRHLPLGQFPGAYRLAAEMALHEQNERQALDGDMAQLEQQWREAEVLAGIADNLLVPASVEARLAALRTQIPHSTKD